MDNEIDKIIKESTFRIEPGKFVYAKVVEAPSIDNHFMISKDKDEITVVTKEENLSELNIKERNKETYRLIALNVSLPFYAVGFLARVTQAIAKESMNILIISTYSRDYILVKESSAQDAKSILLKLGFQEIS